jgi:hypothetical protein
MEIINIILQVALLLLGLYLAFWKSYFTEKGKNLATKEDVGDITNKVERIKNEFEIIRVEYQIQYSKLHGRRSFIIERLYKKLVKLNTAMLSLTAPLKFVNKNAETDEQELLMEASNAFFDFQKYYTEKKIYFHSETFSILEKLKGQYWDSFWDYTEVKRMKSMGVTGISMKESYEKAYKASDSVRVEIPKVLILLEDEFQKILGVTTKNNL